MFTAIILVSLLITFIAITIYKIRLAVALSLLACLYLALFYNDVGKLLDESFKEFARIAIIMTCVAIPAHMIKESKGFEKLAALLGEGAGFLFSKWDIASPYFVSSFFVMVCEYILAAFLHNITAILIMVPISYYFCKSYNIKLRYIFCGQLIASNLGGFSTSWGDTPNIIESEVWQLQPFDFLKEIVVPNLLILFVLIVVVYYVTKFSDSPEERKRKNFNLLFEKNRWHDHFKQINVHWDLFWKGSLILIIFLLLQAIWREYMLVFAAASIFMAIIVPTKTENRNSSWRYSSLITLGMETYLGYMAIFIVASGLRNSEINNWIKSLISLSDRSIMSITATAYFGTLLTEAASWASAAAGTVHQLSPIKSSAWALGGGICAGSSSILTAASAGILLNAITRELGNELTFRDYLLFGLPFSFFMLVFYTGWFSFIY